MIPYQHIGPNLYTPSKRAEDAGYDLVAMVDIHMLPHCTYKVRTGIAVELPANHVGFLMGRSSLNSEGILVSTGVLDSGYRGEIIATVTNSTPDHYNLSKGQRVCQLVIVPCLHDIFQCASSLSSSERGEMGFGSSGK